MATFKEVVDRALDNHDAVLAGRLSNTLRAHGLNYDESYDLINKAHPIDIADWDELLYTADVIDSRQ